MFRRQGKPAWRWRMLQLGTAFGVIKNHVGHGENFSTRACMPWLASSAASGRRALGVVMRDKGERVGHRIHTMAAACIHVLYVAYSMWRVCARAKHAPEE